MSDYTPIAVEAKAVTWDCLFMTTFLMAFIGPDEELIVSAVYADDIRAIK